MNNIVKTLSAIGIALSLSACSVFSSEEPDIYASVNESDVLKDKKPVFSKRVSHIVTFEFDSSELPRNAAEVIEPHVAYLRANQDLRIALQGNASQEGSRAYNYKLAKQRVASVKNLFNQLGISDDRIVLLSVGETHSSFAPQRSVLLVY